MPKKLRFAALLCAALLVSALSLALAADRAEADTTMKRSAGSVSRSAGSRRSSSPGSNTRGRSSSMSSSRSSRSASVRSSRDDDDANEGNDEGADRDDPRRGEYSDSDDTGKQYGSSSKDEVDEEAEEVDYGARTLGRACIYGTRGEVVFRPAGSRCRGDAPSAGSKPPRARIVKKAAGRVPAHPAAAAPSGDRKAPRKTAPEQPARSGARGSCIHGGDGRVLYAPAGADCRLPALSGER